MLSGKPVGSGIGEYVAGSIVFVHTQALGKHGFHNNAARKANVGEPSGTRIK